MKTLERYIPNGYCVIQENKLGCIYGKEAGGKYIAIGYKGKAGKSSWHYRFPTKERMNKMIEQFFSRLASWEEMKFTRKMQRKNELKDVKIGDMFSYSWGYDQTNVEFYQCTGKKANSMIIKEIGRKSYGDCPSGSMSDNVSPVKNQFLADSTPIIKTSLSMKFGHLSPVTENEKKFCSWYA